MNDMEKIILVKLRQLSSVLYKGEEISYEHYDIMRDVIKTLERMWE